MKHNQKWILENLECEGQMNISDFPEICPFDVDNSVTNVDNISEKLHDRNEFIYGPHNPCCTIEECVGCIFGCYLA